MPGIPVYYCDEMIVADSGSPSPSTGKPKAVLAAWEREGLPIELLESLRLLARGRYAYLNAIADYNRAQLELYVALGKPPPNALARPAPPGFVPPPLVQEKPASR